MMAIPMDNDKESSSREGVQRLFNKNVELEKKRRKAAQAKIPSDPNTWQQMRENYEAILLEDHAFSEQHDIEYSLWQLHYRRIEELRALFNAALASAGTTVSQNGKVQGLVGPDRLTKIRSQFKTFLTEATGFYHDLMLKIRSNYGLPLGYFSDDLENQMTMSKDGNKFSEVKKGLISCHRSLIYLGDLARYKGLYGEGDSKALDFAAASSYYLQASSLWPSSGNPQHQLAILAGYKNDELLSTYRYFRSLAAGNPFGTARDNLIIAFEKNRQNYNQLVENSKANLEKTAPSKKPGKGRGKAETRPNFKDNMAATASVKERASSNPELFKAFVTRFIRLNGILFTRTSLETFAEVFSVVKNDLLELLSSGPNEEFSFGADVTECTLIIVRLVVTIIFSVNNLTKENDNQSYADILQLSVLLQNAYTATFEFMGCILERCHQLNDPSSSYLLPGIMVFVEWLASHQDVAIYSALEEKQETARTFFWNKCISLVNKLLSEYMLGNADKDETCFSNMSKYDESESTNRLALPEDFELKGFLPLIPAQTILDFSREHSIGGDRGIKGKVARARRIIAAVKALAGVVRIGHDGFYFDLKLKKFVIGVEHQISDDYLQQMPLESDLYGNTSDISLEGQMALNAVPKLEDSIEDDDEDEVIVFKPSTMEKNLDEFSSKFTSEGLAPVGGAGIIDFKNGNVPSYNGHDSFLLQNAVSMRMTPSTTFSTGTPRYLQPVQPRTEWLVAQDQMVNGLAHLHLMENEPPRNFELEGQYRQFEVSQPAALCVPYPQFSSTGTSPNYTPQISQVALPSNADSFFPSGVDTNSMVVNQPSFNSAVQKKSSVSRPVRHLGPPPGFGSAPSKIVDESFNTAVRNERPLITQVDDYYWLDGYQLPSSIHKAGFNNPINQVGPTVRSVQKNDSTMGLANFPFPGKQSLALQVQYENQKGHQGFQFPETLKTFAEQQQQFQKESG